MKHSTRNLIVASALLGTMAFTGCQAVENIPPDQLDETPVLVDPAMAHRDWELSQAQYARTGIMGPPTLWSFRSKPGPWEWTYAVTETPVFVGNVVLVPVQIFISPAWREREYRAATVPPSYSAMPPLPPSAVDETPPPAPSEPMTEPAPNGG